MTPLRTLSLPGWLDSGPDHWQTLWQRQHGDHKVEQADWQFPRRGDWMVRLEDEVAAHPGPVRLVAHSLGCHLVAFWADRSAHVHRVVGALLVAPPDLEAPDLPDPLHPWRPPLRHALPFPTILVYSRSDPFSAADASLRLAADWQANPVDIGPRGHVNANSGLADWPDGRALLDTLAAAP